MSQSVRLRGASRVLATAVVALAVVSGAPATAQAAPTAPAPVTTPTAEPAPPEPGSEPTPAPQPTPAPAPAEEPVESGDTVTGTLVRVYVDEIGDHGSGDPGALDHGNGDHGREETETWIETGGGEAVRVDSADVADVPLLATVEVTLGTEEPVEPGTPAGTPPTHEVLDVAVVAPAPEPPARPSGGDGAAAGTPTNTLTVVLVAPAGATPDSTTVAQVVAHVTDQVAPWWATESGGTVRIAVAASRDWVTSTKPCTDASGLWADAAAAAGWSPGAGKHLFTYLSTNTPGCGSVAGMGSLGAAPTTGGRLWVKGLSPLVSEHELGHNFGLGHSASTACAGAVETGTCSTVEYGDVYDVMGNWHDGSLNVVQAARIGLLPAPRQQTLASSGTGGAYTLAPNSGSAGVRGIKLTDAGGAVYWLEYRTPSGADAYLADRGRNSAAPYGLQPGVLLHRTSTGGATSVLLDPTPSAGDSYDRHFAFPIGTGVSFGGGNFTVTVQDVTASAATLWIATRTTAAAPARTPIQAAYEASGAINGPLGLAVAGQTCGLTGGGCSQSFAGGSIFWSPGTGAHHVSAAAIATRWTAGGGVDGVLGYPTTDTRCDYWGTTCEQTFQGGRIVTGSTGTYAVAPPFDAAWAARGGADGVLGAPATDATCGLSGGGCTQSFEHGALYWTAATGAHMVSTDPNAWRNTTAITDRWLAGDGQGGALGYPTADAVCGLPSGGCKQAFERGTIYDSWYGTTVMAPGPITDLWLAAGAESGPFGYPRADAQCDAGGCWQRFVDNRTVTWSRATGARTLSDWVGDTWTGFAGAWSATGAGAGPLGYPAGDATCAPGGGCRQAFEDGTLLRARYGDAQVVLDDAIGRYWAARGSENGALGYPSSGPVCTLPGGGCVQEFQSGQRVVWSAAGGAHALTPDAHWAWESTGGAAGRLGYPTGDRFCGLRDRGCGQHFQRGSVYSSDHGTQALYGAIRTAWVQRGSERGPWGYPADMPECGLPGGGCQQRFASGAVVSWSAATGARAVTGPIGWTWEMSGGARGPLGYAAGNEVCGLKDRGCAQHFTKGSVYFSPSTGTHIVSGTIRDRWTKHGRERGALGYPVTDAFCGLRDGGCGQHFAKGSIYWSPKTGARAVTGAMVSSWATQGWERGPLGYPTTDAFCGLRDGGCGQHFAKGSIYWSSRTGAHILSGAIRDRWTAQGRERGALGYPVTDAFCGLRDRGCGQHFAKGSIYWSPKTGAHAVTGAVRDRWAAQGWERSALGYPTRAATTTGRQVVQTFQRGKVVVRF